MGIRPAFDRLGRPTFLTLAHNLLPIQCKPLLLLHNLSRTTAACTTIVDIQCSGLTTLYHPAVPDRRIQLTSESLCQLSLE